MILEITVPIILAIFSDIPIIMPTPLGKERFQ